MKQNFLKVQNKNSENSNNPKSSVQFIIVKTKIQSLFMEILKSPFCARANRESASGHDIWQQCDATI